jgi:hypothetical protein
VQSLSEAQAAQAWVTAGMPLVTYLKAEKNYRQDEIDAMLVDKTAERGPLQNVQVPGPAEQAVTEEKLRPIIEATIAAVGDAALGKIMESGRLEMLTRKEQAAP